MVRLVAFDNVVLTLLLVWTKLYSESQSSMIYSYLKRSRCSTDADIASEHRPNRLTGKQCDCGVFGMRHSIKQIAPSPMPTGSQPAKTNSYVLHARLVHPLCIIHFIFTTLLRYFAVLPSACLYLINHSSKFHQILCMCYLWPWLGPSLTAMQCVIYFWFCG